MVMRASEGCPLGHKLVYRSMSGEMGLYLRAEFWFASTGVGLCGGRHDDSGAIFSSLGNGETTAVPNGAKFSSVRGSGVSVTVGLDVRTDTIVRF